MRHLNLGHAIFTLCTFSSSFFALLPWAFESSCHSWSRVFYMRTGSKDVTALVWHHIKNITIVCRCICLMNTRTNNAWNISLQQFQFNILQQCKHLLFDCILMTRESAYLLCFSQQLCIQKLALGCWCLFALRGEILSNLCFICFWVGVTTNFWFTRTFKLNFPTIWTIPCIHLVTA